MSDIGDRISTLIDASGTGYVWSPADFAQLGSRDVIDKTLQRMVAKGQLRRIDRGLYDKPTVSSLTKRKTTPDYQAVIDAIARRDNLRLLVDGMTAANDLGLTTAVPAKVTVYTDTRRRAIRLDNLQIDFKLCAPSRLYWAGRPAMRLVQALHWLKDMIDADSATYKHHVTWLLKTHKQGSAMRDDLKQGFSVLPIWMQDFLRDLLDLDHADQMPKTKQKSKPKQTEEAQ